MMFGRKWRLAVDGLFMVSVVFAWLILGCLSPAVMAMTGLGSAESPYLIQSRSDFDLFADPAHATVYWPSGVHIRLDTEIDLAGNLYEAALIAPDTGANTGYQGYGFSGDFDGNGHSIANLTIRVGDLTGRECLGFMGQINATGRVHDVEIRALIVDGGADSNFAGGICGINLGRIERCCVTGGSISGVASVGGLCGKNSGTIENSYVTASVAGLGNSNYLGGCCGTNWYGGRIETCYSTGAVTGNGSRGGFCGYHLGAIAACFWDKTASGLALGIGKNQGGNPTLTGLTAVEMANGAHFESADWDYEGSPPVWADGEQRPQLYWQIDRDDLAWQGELDLVVELGESRQIEWTLVNQTAGDLAWTLSNYKSCPWIRAIKPLGGTLAARASATVSITVDGTNLERGVYRHVLHLNFSGRTTPLELQLTVDNRIDLEEFCALSRYWLAGGCGSGSDCAGIDWHKNGSIDTIDLIVLAGSWLHARPVFRLGDTFESGNLYTLNWWTAKDGTGWLAAATEAWQGNYCVRSGSIGDGQSTVLSLTIDLTGTGVDTVGFARRVSSEPDYDWLRFTIDEVLQAQWSGVHGWDYVTYPIVPGIHTFKWVYVKDGAFQGYDDTAWIDDFRLYDSTAE